MNLTIDAYLDRIGYAGARDAAPDTLATLQSAHLHAVPYENLDLLHGIPISLEIDHLFEKVVRRRRGGYCFELNALFGWLLKELGFEVTDLFGRFWRGETAPPPKRRHHVLKVKAGDAHYLCDVGVGGAVPLFPLKLVEGVEQPQGDELYKLERDDFFGWFLQERKQDEWRPVYSFTEDPQLPIDFIAASFWCERSPDSFFHQRAMLALRTPDGRHTVDGDEFRIFDAAGVHAFVPKTKDEYREALRTYFGIVLPDAP